MINLLNISKGLLYALFIYLGIKTGTVLILFVLMSIDSIFGIIKALALNKKFSFKVLLWGAISKLAILLIPLVVALMGKALEFDFTYFVIATLNIIIVSEGISILTNILSIKTKKAIENTDYVTKLLNSLRSIFSQLLEKAIKTIDIKNK